MDKKNLRKRLRKKNSMDIDADFQDQELCCKNPDIEIVDGFWTCRNCGTVYTKELLATEGKMFTKEDVVKKRTHGPVSIRDSYRARTVLTPSERDGVGGRIDKKTQLRFLEMQKIQRSISKKKEKAILKTYTLIQRIAGKVGLPDYIRNTAWNIYLMVNKKHIDRSRPTNLIISSCIYAAVRSHNFPRLLEEIIDMGISDTDSTPNPRKRIMNVIRDIKETVFKELNLTFYPENPKDLIFYFGEHLGWDIKVQRHALKILEYSLNIDQELAGKLPKTLAAASLYLSLSNPEIKKDLIEIARISRDILNKTVNIIKKIVYLVEDDDNLINLVREILEDIPVIELIVKHDKRQALELIKIDNPNLVILGIIPSKIDRIEICNKLRKDDAFMKIPVFAILSSKDPEILSNSKGENLNKIFILPEEARKFRESVEMILK